jgi:hypothetical protein
MTIDPVSKGSGQSPTPVKKQPVKIEQARKSSFNEPNTQTDSVTISPLARQQQPRSTVQIEEKQAKLKQNQTASGSPRSSEPSQAPPSLIKTYTPMQEQRRGSKVSLSA